MAMTRMSRARRYVSWQRGMSQVKEIVQPVTLLVHLIPLVLFDITPRVFSCRHNSTIRHYTGQPMVVRNKTSKWRLFRMLRWIRVSLGFIIGAVRSALITDDRPKNDTVTNNTKGTGTRAAVERTLKVCDRQYCFHSVRDYRTLM